MYNEYGKGISLYENEVGGEVGVDDKICDRVEEGVSTCEVIDLNSPLIDGYYCLGGIIIY